MPCACARIDHAGPRWHRSRQTFAQHQAGLAAIQVIVEQKQVRRFLRDQPQRFLAIARSKDFTLPARQQRLHAAQYIGVVVHHQYSTARGFRRGEFRHGRSLGRRRRTRHLDRSKAGACMEARPTATVTTAWP